MAGNSGILKRTFLSSLKVNQGSGLSIDNVTLELYLARHRAPTKTRLLRETTLKKSPTNHSMTVSLTNDDGFVGDNKYLVFFK